ncbi:MAG: hypothetical protein LBE83_09420 [Propionibacteriaceae bacterium]|nr:hypothetical protein [Propionibacteriaceae bacterium]
MTEVKSLPRRLVGIVEAMEFDQPHVVTLPMLAQMASACGAATDESGARKLAYRLQELGWLGRVRTKNAWEFLPGSRAGAISSGDRFLEFRAYRAVHSGWPGVLAMESAASLIGLAQHLPSREVIALPPGTALPKALSEWRAVTFYVPAEGREIRDHMPTWNINGLIAGIAIRPSGYQDLPSLAQWLPETGSKINEEILKVCLATAPESAWQRAAYLARLAGADQIADSLLAQCPPRHSVWFGATRTGGTYDPVTKVNDADLASYLEGGTGA